MMKSSMKVRHINEALANAGYTVDVVASDGYTVTFDAARLLRNDNIFVANKVNGNPLNEDDFPLRLVGSDLERSERVGAIAEIIVHLPEAPAYGTDPIFRIFGLVNAEQNLSEADLHGMEVVDITAEHPRNGPTPYTGVYLNALLDPGGRAGWGCHAGAYRRRMAIRPSCRWQMCSTAQTACWPSPIPLAACTLSCLALKAVPG